MVKADAEATRAAAVRARENFMMAGGKGARGSRLGVYHKDHESRKNPYVDLSLAFVRFLAGN